MQSVVQKGSTGGNGVEVLLAMLHYSFQIAFEEKPQHQDLYYTTHNVGQPKTIIKAYSDGWYLMSSNNH